MDYAKLNTIAEISSGQGAPQGSNSYSTTGMPFIKAGNLDDLLSTKNEYKSCQLVSQKIAQKYKLKEYPTDTIVFAKSGMSAMKGRVYCLNNSSYVVNHLATIVPDKNKVEPRYLKYFFQVFSPTKLIKDRAYPSIRLQDIGNVKVSLPVLTEQQSIVNLLDQADSLRHKRKQAIDLLDDYLKSAFLEMFGDPVLNTKKWQLMKLSKVGTLERGKSKHRPRNAPELLGGPYPLIQTGEVANSGGYIKNYSQTYSKLGLEQSRMWPIGTLCITIAANIAKTGILTFEACFPDSVVGFTPNEKVKTEYVQYWFKFLQKILEEKAPESAQKNINLAILRNLDIPVPPIELQDKFVEKTQIVENLRMTMKKQSHELDSQFNALMLKSFSIN